MAEEVKTTSVITAASSADVAFTDKIGAVDKALKDRAAVTNKLKKQWGKISEFLVENGQEVPYRRLDAANAHQLVNKITIYEKPDERLNDKEAVRYARDGAYIAQSLLQKTKLMLHLEKSHYGLTKDLQAMVLLDDLSNTSLEVDKDQTKKVRAELKALVKEYTDALEEYEETVNHVADVKEYIGVVKDVAEISAIASGAQKKNEQ